MKDQSQSQNIEAFKIVSEIKLNDDIIGRKLIQEWG